MYTFIKHYHINANLIVSQRPFTSYTELRSDPARIPIEVEQAKWNEFKLCIEQRGLAFNSLVMDLSDYFHPNSLRCIAIREIVVGTLFPRLRSWFGDDPNVA